MLEWIKDNVFDYGSVVEWMGLLAAALVLVSFLMKDERTIRIVNIVGAFVFVVYGVMIKSASVWLMNFALVVVHNVRLKKISTKKTVQKPLDNDKSSIDESQSSGTAAENIHDDEPRLDL